MVLRIFDCDLYITAALDLLAHPHSSIPYVRMGLITKNVCVVDSYVVTRLS